MTVSGPGRDWAYASSCEVYLPSSSGSEDKASNGGGDLRDNSLQESASPRCYDSTGRHLCLCVEGTLLEFDLETATCVCDLRVGDDLVALCYLCNKGGEGGRVGPR